MKPLNQTSALAALFVLLALLSACADNKADLPLIQETKHAQFYSPNSDAGPTAAVLAETFEANYDRLVDLFHYDTISKTIVRVYTNRDEYQKMIGRNTEGTYDAKDRMIKVYTPADLSDPVTKHNFEEQIVHEFVHQVIQQISPGVGKVKWLDEGTAYYASNQLEEEMQTKTVYYDKPTFEQFVDPDYFNKAGGAAYFYSGLIIKYIVDKYGADTLNEMIRHPDQEHTEKALNTTIDKFFEAWSVDAEER